MFGASGQIGRTTARVKLAGDLVDTSARAGEDARTGRWLSTPAAHGSAPGWCGCAEAAVGDLLRRGVVPSWAAR